MPAQLHNAYLGELYGIAFFQYFANNYHDSHYQEHWQLLTEIEELTAQLLEQGLKPLGIECTPHNSEMEQKGISDAKKWQTLTWPDLIKTMVDWVAPYQIRYQQQSDLATEYKELYKLVADHENAIYNYLVAEHQGSGESLTILRQFLAAYR
ncbi:hypothetical protein [Photobacterium damselae]|uniref:hypothetical protein n=1 Tax=Photobacterium damselae TaxID=38293 RepID=UPI0010FEE675|nr:hypothetical protein [Photobacterium damselae]TLS79292.1 hypothetical protein FD721_06320 [Photobacterium damselae subsp. damselae]TLS87371.1 hypothetical protein FD720_08005 [Photobacterium damselae subsp. damselae]